MLLLSCMGHARGALWRRTLQKGKAAPCSAVMLDGTQGTGTPAGHPRRKGSEPPVQRGLTAPRVQVHRRRTWDMADTITNFLAELSSEMMDATLAMRSGVPTQVPPNLCTAHLLPAEAPGVLEAGASCAASAEDGAAEGGGSGQKQQGW